MKRLTSIVAVNGIGAIGCHNGLPWRLKNDLRFFREQTSGGIVIMGRMTLDSMGKPLPNRHNIVLSHNNVLFPKTDNSEVATSLAEALVVADRRKGEIFVVGGASTYKQFAPYVDRYLVTVVEKDVPDADAFFDQSIFSNEEDWNWRKIEEVKYSPDQDEVPFQVFEMLHKRPADISSAREELMADYVSRIFGRSKKGRTTLASVMPIADLQFQYR